MSALAESEVRDAFRAACRAELAALKPGNVHIHAAGHAMTVGDFERAAEAAVPWIAAPGLDVGARILAAVEASMAATGCNTNLGILLLSVPLAAAALLTGGGDLETRLAAVLASLGPADAEAVYAAIRRANPGGLGSSAEADVAVPPTVSLHEAMHLAADRDRIARAYVTGFEEIFQFGLPALAAARRVMGEETDAVTALHMAFLAHAADSHIARKQGPEVAAAVMQEAVALAPFLTRRLDREARSVLLAYDASLKDRSLNPGTTADLVVATLLADHLQGRLALSEHF